MDYVIPCWGAAELERRLTLGWQNTRRGGSALGVRCRGPWLTLFTGHEVASIDRLARRLLSLIPVGARGQADDSFCIERTRQDLRIINGAQLVELVLGPYEALDAEWKQLLPFSRVYVVARTLRRIAKSNPPGSY